METTIAGADGGRANKKAVRRTIYLFVLVLVGLTFFSGTLMNMSLPQVTVEQPAPGTLAHEITGAGAVEAAETADLYTETSWAVSEVSVKVGDKVEAGQVVTVFRTDDAQRTLQDDEAKYKQQQLNLQKLQDNFTEAARSGDDKTMRSISRDIESAKLDMQVMERQIANLQRQLAAYSRLAAPVAGIVTEVNAVLGTPVPNGKAAVRIADLAKGQVMKAVVDFAEAQYAAVGDETELVFAALNNARVKAKITDIRDAYAGQEGSSGSSAQSGNDAKQEQITFTMRDDRLKGGERGEFDIVKRTKPIPLLLPNEALRQDNSGKYVLVLKEKKGPLGSEYELVRSPVQTGDADDTKTSVASGVTPLDKVVVSSTKSVAEGDRVMPASD
jgi:RND family efflux transporter MFP subunit